NKLLGIAVPGAICAGSSNQRKVQSGFKRCDASRKFGAIALASCVGSPVIWHFKQGVPETKMLRAIDFSDSVKGTIGSLIYGSFCDDTAMKKRTSMRSSLGEKLNVGMCTWL